MNLKFFCLHIPDWLRNKSIFCNNWLLLHSAGTFSSVPHKMIDRDCLGLCYIWLKYSHGGSDISWINENILFLTKGIYIVCKHTHQGSHAHILVNGYQCNSWLWFISVILFKYIFCNSSKIDLFSSLLRSIFSLVNCLDIPNWTRIL